jgi:transposase
VRSAFLWLGYVVGDSAYAGDKRKGAPDKLDTWTMAVVKRSDAAAKDLVLLSLCWVVERTLDWRNRNRRLAKDFEATIESAVTRLYIASAQLMPRRLSVARTARMSQYHR